MNNIKRPWDAPGTPYGVCKSLLYNKLPGVYKLYHGQVQTLALFLSAAALISTFHPWFQPVFMERC